MTESRCFFDTNLLVYLYSTDPKSAVVESLIRAKNGYPFDARARC